MKKNSIFEEDNRKKGTKKGELSNPEVVAKIEGCGGNGERG
jgi:hypothetical protein